MVLKEWVSYSAALFIHAGHLLHSMPTGEGNIITQSTAVTCIITENTALHWEINNMFIEITGPFLLQE